MQPDQIGQWGPVLDWDDLVAIHGVHLPNGYILVWQNGSSTGVWNAYTETFVDEDNNGARDVFPLGANIFCAGHAHLANGSALVIGGTVSGMGDGIPQADIFHWPSIGPSPWETATTMTYGRWYPTCTVLPSGQLLATSGRDQDHIVVGIPEVYNPITNTWQELPGANKVISLYPFMFVTPTGDVFYAGPTVNTRLLNVQQEQWGVNIPSSFSGDTAVMYSPGKVMKCGGAVAGSCIGDPKQQDDRVAIANTAVIDLTAASPAWQNVQDMNYGRRRLDLTLLADCTVVATGGTGCENSEAFAVRAADLFDPATNTWTEMASTNESDPPRMYHSVSLLLPDARVLTAGGNDQPTAQIFSPPYLFRGPRPEFTSIGGVITYGTAFELLTPQAATITKINLLRLGAVTHEFDQDQRCVPLAFEVIDDQSLSVGAPLNGNFAPPGYYMLFIIRSNGAPSMAEYVRVRSPCPPDLNGDGTVNLLDLIDLLLCFGLPAVPGCQAEDINNDGVVNVLDLIDLLLEFGLPCP